METHIISIRDFWNSIVEPSKHMDRLCAAYGITRKFEYLLVHFTGSKIRKVKAYTTSDEVFDDDDTMKMCHVDEGQMGTSIDGRYVFYLTVSTIK